jgi:hypothetical protein
MVADSRFDGALESWVIPVVLSRLVNFSPPAYGAGCLEARNIARQETRLPKSDARTAIEVPSPVHQVYHFDNEKRTPKIGDGTLLQAETLVVDGRGLVVLYMRA